MNTSEDNIIECRICENNEAHLQDFVRLNEEWITRYFELEAVDRALAKNPRKVIEDGGIVYSLIVDGKVVGACALFNKQDDIYELARMAVSPDYRGQGFGEKLLQACLKKLNEINAKKVCLVSNSKLTAAISLYKKHGFQTVSEGSHPIYSRANIAMERDFSKR